MLLWIRLKVTEHKAWQMFREAISQCRDLLPADSECRQATKESSSLVVGAPLSLWSKVCVRQVSKTPQNIIYKYEIKIKDPAGKPTVQLRGPAVLCSEARLPRLPRPHSDQSHRSGVQD